MDWDKLRVFHLVADAGSFTRAGEALSLSQSAVSRQVRALEKSLSTVLFHRHARGLLLTEQGELLLRTTREVFGKLAAAEAALADSRQQPRGPLRVTTTVGFGSMWLTGQIGDFLDNYPDIQVTLLVADVELDLSMREADVAVRVRPQVQSDLVQRRLFTGTFGVFAVREYLTRFGSPRGVADLGRHRLIGYGEGFPKPFAEVNWLIDKAREAAPGLEPAFTVNNTYGILRAVEAGIGMALLPAFLARQNPALVRVLHDIEAPEVEAYFVYPEEMRGSQRVVAFRDFLLRKVAETQF